MEPQTNDNLTQLPLATSALPKKNNTFLIIIFSTLLLGFFGSTTYLAYQNNLLKQEILSLQQQTDLPTPTATLTPTSSPTPDPTADWKTYQSPRHNYTFSYPSDWFLNAWDETNEQLLTGTHTIQNYDPNDIENFMDHGIVDWNAFIGNNEAFKLDITLLSDPTMIAQSLQSNRENIEQITDHNITILKKRPSVYRPKEVGPGPAQDLVLLDVELKTNTHLFIGIYGFHINDPDLLRTTSWETINKILSTFKFIE